MKIMLFFLWLVFINTSYQALFSKDKNSKFYYPILSVKAGFHTGDNSDYESFPSGYSIDGTLEISTGKGWYVALNYDVSYASGNEAEWYGGNPVRKNYTNYNFTPLAKYRFVFDKIALYAGLGIGVSGMVVEYEGGREKNEMLSMNIRIGIDYFLGRNIILSAEGVFQEMSEIDFGGGGRHNKIFQGKAGIGYIMNLP